MAAHSNAIVSTVDTTKYVNHWGERICKEDYARWDKWDQTVRIKDPQEMDRLLNETDIPWGDWDYKVNCPFMTEKLAKALKKIYIPCQWHCHEGVLGAIVPAEGKWKAGCNIEDCNYLHPGEPGWSDWNEHGYKNYYDKYVSQRMAPKSNKSASTPNKGAGAGTTETKSTTAVTAVGKKSHNPARRPYKGRSAGTAGTTPATAVVVVAQQSQTPAPHPYIGAGAGSAEAMLSAVVVAVEDESQPMSIDDMLARDMEEEPAKYVDCLVNGDTRPTRFTREQALSLIRLDAWDTVQNTISLATFEANYGKLTSEEHSNLFSKFTPVKPVAIPKTEAEEALNCKCDECKTRYRTIYRINDVDLTRPESYLYQDTMHAIASFERFTNTPNTCEGFILRKQQQTLIQEQIRREQKSNFKSASKEQIAEWTTFLQGLDQEKYSQIDQEQTELREYAIIREIETQFCPVAMERAMHRAIMNREFRPDEEGNLLNSTKWIAYIHYGKEQYELLEDYRLVRNIEVTCMEIYDAIESIYEKLRKHIRQHGLIITHRPRRTHKKPVIVKKKLGRRARRNAKLRNASVEEEEADINIDEDDEIRGAYEDNAQEDGEDSEDE